MGFFGGGGGITNSAGANVVPKSDGTNLVASRITDDGTEIILGSTFLSLGNMSGVNNLSIGNSVSMGDTNGEGNSTSIVTADANSSVQMFTSGDGFNVTAGVSIDASNASGSKATVETDRASLKINDVTDTAILAANLTTGAINLNASAVNANSSPVQTLATLAASPVPLSASLANNTTNASTTLTSTDLVVTVTSGVTYEFTLTLFLSNSTPSDGAKIDFNGGSATVSNFRAHATIFDSALLLSTQVTALNTAITVATITGASMIEVHGTLTASSTATFVPLFAKASHTGGTLTLFKGSNLILRRMP